MNRKSQRDGLRYLLWGLMAYTAFANRQHYRMVTTWLPHLLTNTLSLLLPDAVRVLFSPRHKPRNIVEDTLIAAPTGSGKTLAGFLVAIDALYRAHAHGQDIAGATRVVYVSPLKALAVDIAQNLERPLAEIGALAV